MKSILIAGIGNIFQGDDAFGVEVIRQLRQRDWPEEVEVIDFGIWAYDLAYTLSLDFHAVILVDAVSRGQPPGTVYLIRPERIAAAKPASQPLDPHGWNPDAILQMALSFELGAGQMFLVGCEPAVLECAGGDFGLSAPVAAAVPKAVEVIANLVQALRGETQPAHPGLVLA